MLEKRLQTCQPAQRSALTHNNVLKRQIINAGNFQTLRSEQKLNQLAQNKQKEAAMNVLSEGIFRLSMETFHKMKSKGVKRKHQLLSHQSIGTQSLHSTV